MGVLAWIFMLFASILACIVIGVLVNLVFNAMYPKNCSECEKRKRDCVVDKATQNVEAVLNDGGDDID